ncbi:hypothetical protein FA10DRAFT_286753 [Acaromyces ingoldii]|uniref:Uncharacterized protein n=1 Tax=Acaromyces ingoldii TaxID=215250 RepID=A0A316YJQ6_9BASI|nr:hypothetical protein FA10DRAFT_286753 [Acaromyces ingoldii]PWN88848.1 hypothetical protein FA10DRAFT_286753 [Acaromyces ingoldii]
MEDSGQLGRHTWHAGRFRRGAIFSEDNSDDVQVGSSRFDAAMEAPFEHWSSAIDLRGGLGPDDPFEMSNKVLSTSAPTSSALMPSTGRSSESLSSSSSDIVGATQTATTSKTSTRACTPRRRKQEQEKSQRYNARVQKQRKIIAGLFEELQTTLSRALDSSEVQHSLFALELKQALAHRRPAPTIDSSAKGTPRTDNERKRTNKLVHRCNELEKLECVSLLAGALLSRCDDASRIFECQVDANNLAEEMVRWSLVEVFRSWNKEWLDLEAMIERTRGEVMYIKGDPLLRLLQCPVPR